LSRRKQMVEEHFDTVSEEPDWSPRYNIAVLRKNLVRPRYAQTSVEGRSAVQELHIHAALLFNRYS
jgi:hypothetical protein